MKRSTKRRGSKVQRRRRSKVQSRSKSRRVSKVQRRSKSRRRSSKSRRRSSKSRRGSTVENLLSLRKCDKCNKFPDMCPCRNVKPCCTQNYNNISLYTSKPINFQNAIPSCIKIEKIPTNVPEYFKLIELVGCGACIKAKKLITDNGYTLKVKDDLLPEEENIIKNSVGVYEYYPKIFKYNTELQTYNFIGGYDKLLDLNEFKN
jgi:hypothetical protein